MSTTMSINAASIGTTNAIGSSSSSMDTATLALLIYGMEIQRTDQRIQDALTSVQQESKLRDIISARIDKLQDLKALVTAAKNDASDDDITFASLLRYKYEDGRDFVDALKKARDIISNPLAQGSTAELKAIRELPVLMARVLTDFAPVYYKNSAFSLDAHGNRVIREGEPFFKTTVEWDKGVKGINLDAKISVDVIDKEIKRLEGQIHTLDSNREIGMIGLNDMLNKKGNIVTQLTNILRSHHETAKTILNNLR